MRRPFALTMLAFTICAPAAAQQLETLSGTAEPTVDRIETVELAGREDRSIGLYELSGPVTLGDVSGDVTVQGVYDLRGPDMGYSAYYRIEMTDGDTLLGTLTGRADLSKGEDSGRLFVRSGSGRFDGAAGGGVYRASDFGAFAVGSTLRYEIELEVTP